jgi:hypothetical protein
VKLNNKINKRKRDEDRFRAGNMNEDRDIDRAVAQR